MLGRVGGRSGLGRAKGSEKMRERLAEDYLNDVFGRGTDLTADEQRSVDQILLWKSSVCGENYG